MHVLLICISEILSEYIIQVSWAEVGLHLKMSYCNQGLGHIFIVSWTSYLLEQIPLIVC